MGCFMGGLRLLEEKMTTIDATDEGWKERVPKRDVVIGALERKGIDFVCEPIGTGEVTVKFRSRGAQYSIDFDKEGDTVRGMVPSLIYRTTGYRGERCYSGSTPCYRVFAFEQWLGVPHLFLPGAPTGK